MNTFARFFVGLLLPLAVFSTSVSALDDDPKFTLQKQIDLLITRFTADRPALEQDRTKLYALAEELTATGWDFEKMARLVLGKNWRTASESQQSAFTQEFKQLLIRTYASAMFSYTGKESIDYGETRYLGKNKERATVAAEGDLGNGSPKVPLNFSYFKDKSGGWNIYNIDVDGVSLVTVYRVSYNNLIAAKGMDALIADIRAKNQQPGS